MMVQVLLWALVRAARRSAVVVVVALVVGAMVMRGAMVRPFGAWAATAVPAVVQSAPALARVAGVVVVVVLLAVMTASLGRSGCWRAAAGSCCDGTGGLAAAAEGAGGRCRVGEGRPSHLDLQQQAERQHTPSGWKLASWQAHNIYGLDVQQPSLQRQVGACKPRSGAVDVSR